MSNVLDVKLGYAAALFNPFLNDSASELAENLAISKERTAYLPTTSDLINVRRLVAKNQIAMYQPGKEAVGQRWVVQKSRVLV